MAKIAVGNREDALDILQDTMYKLAEKYSMRQATEWPALFYTILQSRIRDWYRRETVRNRFRVWFGNEEGKDNVDGFDRIENSTVQSPEDALQNGRLMADLEIAVRQLPLRQQQAFMLRVFEEFNVKDTATIMGCSEGSVKTHYSRAVSSLRDKLGGDYS